MYKTIYIAIQHTHLPVNYRYTQVEVECRSPHYDNYQRQH